MREFINLIFEGKTTSPWYVGKCVCGNQFYTRTDILWGRGVRGAVLRQLWRTYCHLSDIIDRARFDPKKDCRSCDLRFECPFNALRGVDKKGDFKDTPKIVFTNLYFNGDIKTDWITIAPFDDRHRNIIRKRSAYIEYIKPGVNFYFEVILTGRGIDFKNEIIKAVKTSLKFFGWGGFCNEGFGRGEIKRIEERNFDKFDAIISKISEEVVDNVKDYGSIKFKITPMLILEKKDNSPYLSIVEKGFKEKFLHSLVERYWQFYKDKKYPEIKEIFGETKRIRIRGWSRRDRREQIFEGIGGELTVEFSELDVDTAKVIAISKYGIGKYKNQGFGSLLLNSSLH